MSEADDHKWFQDRYIHLYLKYRKMIREYNSDEFPTAITLIELIQIADDCYDALTDENKVLAKLKLEKERWNLNSKVGNEYFG